MYLTQLDITGFKSFPDKVSLQFKPGMTAVVGPNGSGKSNIADALRWVMGEQSAKSLRGAKMEDVIFSGTAHRKPLGYAEIVMRLDNTDRQLAFDFNEVTVIRRVYRSGESEYLLNDTACRLRDIQALFMDTGVGRDGYSIIGQGRIDEILSVRSEDRRLLFEEAAGIVKYKSRRSEAFQKLERERQNRERVDDIVLELESQLEPLQKQSEQAKTYLSLRERYKTVHINIFLEDAGRIQAETESLDEKLKIIKEQSERGRILLAETRAEDEELKSAASDVSAHIKLTNEKILELATGVEKKESEIQLLDAKARTVQANRVRYEEETAKRNESAEEKLAESAKEEEAKSAVSAELEKLNLELYERQGGFEELDEIMRERENALSGHNKLIMEQIALASELKTSLREAENLYQRLEDDKERLNGEILHNETLLEAEEKNQASRLAALKAGGDETAKGQDAVNSINQERLKLSKGCDSLLEAYQRARQKWQDIASRHKALQALEDHHEGYNRSVKAVLAKKAADSRYEGIRGAVGELIGVSGKYEIAVETALGGAAQNIVTRTEKDAQLAIEMLKSTREGRATFLPLTAIKPRYLDADKTGVSRERGYVGLAADIVTYDAEYFNVISSLLGNVIVMDRLDDAVRLNKKYRYAYKIVTLEGELLSPGGAITGGSRQTHGAGFVGRSRQLTELASQMLVLKDETDALEKKIKEEKSKLSATEEALSRARDNYQEMLLEQNNLRNQVSQSDEKLKNLRNMSEKLDSDNDALMGRLIETNKEIRRLKSECAKQDGAVELARDEMEEYRRKITDERVRQSEQNQALTELRVEIGRKTEELSRISQNIFRLGKEYGALNAEKTLLVKEIAEADGSLAQVNKELETARALRNEWRARLNERQAELVLTEERRVNIENAITSGETEERAKREENSLLEKEAARLEMRREQLETESRRLYGEIWEEYELTYQTALQYKLEVENYAALKREWQSLKAELSVMTDVNVGAIEQFRLLSERRGFLTAQRDDILKAEETLSELIAELTARMESRFSEQFGKISVHFNDVFREMFSGGQAGIKLLDEKNILDSGIEITAQPPGKSLQTLSLLSGGERALTAIALLFAILRLKPSPFCVLDEIEAALDDANVTRFAEFIKNYSKQTQFIVITHRKGTMEAADTLYGVTMQEQGISALVSVRFAEDAERAN